MPCPPSDQYFFFLHACLYSAVYVLHGNISSQTISYDAHNCQRNCKQCAQKLYSATLQVSLNGRAKMSYQWHKDELAEHANGWGNGSLDLCQHNLHVQLASDIDVVQGHQNSDHGAKSH